MSELRDALIEAVQAAHSPTATAAPVGTHYEYDAFISYRRRDAAALARWIRDCLQRYKLPPEVFKELSPEKKALHERQPRVWLDKAFEKPSDDFLTKKIYPALDSSARLIVVSTPSVFETVRGKGGTEEPNWLVREIDRFLDGTGEDTNPRPVDVVLGPGGSEDRFPGRLTERERWDWIDLRLYNRWRSFVSEELDVGLTKLVAGLYDIPEAQLPALRREERRRRNRLLVGMAIFAITVAMIIGGLGLYAWQQQRIASRNSEIAEARRLTAEAELIITQQPARLGTGVLLAAEAVGRFRRLNLDSPEASEIVRRGLALLPRITERQPIAAPAVTVSRDKAVFSSRGRYFAVSKNDKVIQIFDLRGGRSGLELAHEAPVNYIRFSEDERYIVTATGINDIANPVIWDLTQKKPKKVFEKQLMIQVMALSADGRYIMTSGKEGAVVWETATGEIAYSWLDKSEIMATEFSPDGRYLGLTNRLEQGREKIEYNLVLFEVGNWTKARVITIDKYANIVRFSPNSQNISVASGANSIISTWEVASGTLVSRMNHNYGNGIDKIYFSPMGNFLASGSYDMSTRIWRTRDGSEVTRIKGNGLGYAIAFSPDEKFVVTAFAGDNVARIWNTHTGAEMGRMPHGNAVLATSFLPDGKHLATASSDGYLRLWTMPSTSVAEHELDRELQAVSVSVNGRYLATLSSVDRHHDRPPRARIWDFVDNKEIFAIVMDKCEHDQLGYGNTEQRWIAISSDGKYLAAVGYWGAGHVAQVWDTESRREIFRVASPVPIQSVALSSTGKHLATVSRGVGRLWDVKGQPTHSTEFQARDVRFSGDEKFAVVIEGDKEENTSLQVYALETGNKVHSLKVTDGVSQIAVSHNGKLVATSYGGAIQVWEVAAGRVVCSFKQNERITFLAFDLSAEFLAASTREGSAQIYRLRTGQKFYRLYHEGYLAAVAFSESKNGKRLLTANGSVVRPQGESAPNEKNSACLWYWEQADIIAEACKRLSGFTEPELLQDIDSTSLFEEICPNLGESKVTPVGFTTQTSAGPPGTLTPGVKLGVTPEGPPVAVTPEVKLTPPAQPPAGPTPTTNLTTSTPSGLNPSTPSKRRKARSTTASKPSTPKAGTFLIETHQNRQIFGAPSPGNR